MDDSTMPARWKPLFVALGQWNAHFAPHITKLEVQTCNERDWTMQIYQQRHKTHPVEQTSSGVYLIYNKAQELLYIGMTMGVFDDQIWSHDEQLDRWYTDVIPVSDDVKYLIPSLELFLIKKLKPRENVLHTEREGEL